VNTLNKLTTSYGLSIYLPQEEDTVVPKVKDTLSSTVVSGDKEKTKLTLSVKECYHIIDFD